jgi:hypothetical protein
VPAKAAGVESRQDPRPLMTLMKKSYLIDMDGVIYREII